MAKAKLAPLPTELPFPAGAPKDLKVSCEFFPPKTEKMAENLWRSITRLAPLFPMFLLLCALGLHEGMAALPLRAARAAVP